MYQFWILTTIVIDHRLTNSRSVYVFWWSGWENIIFFRFFFGLLKMGSFITFTKLHILNWKNNNNKKYLKFAAGCHWLLFGWSFAFKFVVVAAFFRLHSFSQSVRRLFVFIMAENEDASNKPTKKKKLLLLLLLFFYFLKFNILVSDVCLKS